MDWKLEVVIVPVTDIDRAKHFYGEQVGFTVDYDNWVGDEIRNVQLTPPGSGCSIALTTQLVLPTGPGGAWNSFVSFADPDGNSWLVQERP